MKRTLNAADSSRWEFSRSSSPHTTSSPSSWAERRWSSTRPAATQPRTWTWRSRWLRKSTPRSPRSDSRRKGGTGITPSSTCCSKHQLRPDFRERTRRGPRSRSTGCGWRSSESKICSSIAFAPGSAGTAMRTVAGHGGLRVCTRTESIGVSNSQSIGLKELFRECGPLCPNPRNAGAVSLPPPAPSPSSAGRAAAPPS